MPSDWKILANKARKGAEKYGKEGFKFAKQAAAESGLLGSYTIGGKEVVELKKLASGGFGSVKLVRDVNTNQEYALKKIKCMHGPSQVACTTEEAEREARLLSKISHHNIVKCIAWGRREGVKRGTSEILLLIELCPGGHVADFLHKNKGVIRPKEIVDCLYDTTDALHFLHNWQRVPICHRDVKMENIIRAKDGKWKICDFGSMCCRNVIYPKELSKKGLMDLQDEIEKKVTMMYRPPEMVDLNYSRDDRENDWPIGPAVDIWMIGCVLYCLLFGSHPFKDAATAMAIRNAKYYLPRNHPNMSMKNLMLLAQWIMSPRPEDRPDSDKILTLLEGWQSSPDIFEMLPEATQERLQKSWNLYGLKFTGKDRSSEGVFKKSRFQFTAKNDDLMKKPSADQSKSDSRQAGPKRTEPDKQSKVSGESTTSQPAVPCPPPNLLDFDDDMPPAIIADPASQFTGSLLDFGDEPSPTPVAAPTYGDFSGPAVGSSNDPFGGDPFGEPQAAAPMASTMDPFGGDPFGEPQAAAPMASTMDPFGGDPFVASQAAAPMASAMDPFGGDPFGASQATAPMASIMDPFGGDPFGASQTGGPATSAMGPFGGDSFGVTPQIGGPARPSGGDPFGAPAPAIGGSDFDPFSFIAAPLPAIPVLGPTIGGIPGLAPPPSSGVPLIAPPPPVNGGFAAPTALPQQPGASNQGGGDLLDF